jgi:coenzyme PQQ synthesis protein D (PqqD)
MTELRLKDADLHWREIDGEVIALEARGSTYLAANGAGTLLWRALAVGATREALADELARAYGIDRERAAADTDRFLAELAEQGLLVTA